MTKEELAAKLNGRQYGKEINREEDIEAAKNNLVVVFGASDDLLEFRGVIREEFGAYQGTTILLSDSGLPLENKCDSEDCPYFKELFNKATLFVRSSWNWEGYSWMIDANIPYAPFDIFEDDEKYCRGIVFELPH